MKRYLIIIFIPLLWGCMPEEELPLRNMGEINGYFIESYCKPGQPIALTATTILAVAEELNPDFYISMDVWATALYPIHLKHKLFTIPGSNFIYNYGSDDIFDPKGADTLYLNILTPEQQQIRAKTFIPSQVTIDTAWLTNNTAGIRFYSSRNPDENYYLYTLQLAKGDSLLEKEVSYLDYNSFSPTSMIERTITSSLIEHADYALLSLKRITRECYDYQISLNKANSAQQGSITTPVPLAGNIEGAWGIFTYLTEELRLFQLTKGEEPKEIDLTNFKWR